VPGALTTFHVRLMGPEPDPEGEGHTTRPGPLRRAIATCLGVDVAAVYDGRRPQAVKAAVDCCLTILARRPFGRRQVEHVYRVAVRVRGVDGATRKGKNQLDSIDYYLAALEAAFGHGRPLQDSVGSDLQAARLVRSATDVDPDEVGTVEGQAELVFLTNGTGDLDGLQSPGG
jgi:hypothetical protein